MWRPACLALLAGFVGMYAGPAQAQSPSPRMFEHAAAASARSCGFSLDGDAAGALGRLASPWDAYREQHRAAKEALLRGEAPRVLVWHCRTREICGGSGNQIYGVAFALYLAVATSRLLFVDWSRSGYNIANLLQPRYIDWGLPPHPLDCESRDLDWLHSFPQRPVLALQKMSERCIYLRTNMRPDYLEWPGHVETDGGRLASFAGFMDARYRMGCAFHFLFKPSEHLSDLVATRTPRGAHAASLVGVHMRHGDAYMVTSDVHTDHRMELNRTVLKLALQCANRLAGRVYKETAAKPHMLYFSDSAESRASAAELAKTHALLPRATLHTPQREGRDPAHSDDLEAFTVEAHSALLDVWAEQMALAQARGILLTDGTFARASAQIGLLPPASVWYFESRRYCGPLSQSEALRGAKGDASRVLPPNIIKCATENSLSESELFNFQMGNPWCFDNHKFTFHRCCKDTLGGAGCFLEGSPFTYRACCYSGDIVWYAHGPHAEALFQPSAEFTDDRKCPTGDCSAARGTSSLQEFSSGLLWRGMGTRVGVAVGRPNKLGCRRARGQLHNVTVSFGLLDLVPQLTKESKVHRVDFHFCAPLSCNPEDVAAVLAPRYFLRGLGAIGYSPTLFHMDAVSTELFNGQFHRLGEAGNMVRPVSDEELAAYRRMFWTCGRCGLRRYGDPEDGGYLMCPVDGEGEAPYAGIYSYGEGVDSWGRHVSTATGLAVHRYICRIGPKSTCDRPCPFIFHNQCGTNYDVWRGHLEENGHGNLTDGQLLLKFETSGTTNNALDIFTRATASELQKFRQIVVELENPYVDGLMDWGRYTERTSMMENLLAVFAVVHVHPSNLCGDIGYCRSMEVTFYNKAFIDPAPCHVPERHALDSPNAPMHPDIDVTQLLSAPVPYGAGDMLSAS